MRSYTSPLHPHTESLLKAFLAKKKSMVLISKSVNFFASPNLRFGHKFLCNIISMVGKHSHKKTI